MSQIKMPTGWSKSRIGDVVEDRIEQGLPEGKSEFTYIDISAVDNRRKEIVEPRVLPTASAPSRARQQVKRDDVLVSTTRPNLNAVALVPPQLDGEIASTGFAVLRPVLLEPRWLFSVVQSEDFITEMSALVKGALYPAIRPGHVHDYVMPVPPVAEQKRITAKLGSLLKRTSAVHEALETLPDLIQQYRTAVLEAACTGRLVPTEAELARKKHRDFEPASVLLERTLVERHAKWEADQLAKMRAGGKNPKADKWKERYRQPSKPQMSSLPSLPPKWCWAGTEELTAGIENAMTIGPFGSNLKVKDYKQNGVPLIFVREIRSANFRRNDTRYISQEKAEELASHKVRGGDVVITKMGEPPGDTSIYPRGYPDAIATSDCIKLTPNPAATSAEFLKHIIRSKIVKDQILDISRGVAQQKMSLARFKTVAIPLPPLAEQKRIVAEVERRFAILDHIEMHVLDALRQTSKLRASLFHRALSGKLVPQTPDDEAASVLLGRIAAARESHREDRKKEARKPMKKKTETPAAKRDLLEILDDHTTGLTPDQLMAEAGYTSDEVPVFYKALRKVEKEIQEVRPERKVVILKRRRA